MSEEIKGAPWRLPVPKEDEEGWEKDVDFAPMALLGPHGTKGPECRRGSGKVVATNELCDLFGISRGQIREWVKQGCPQHTQALKQGHANKYNTAEVFLWKLRKLLNEYSRMHVRKDDSGKVVNMNVEKAKHERIKRQRAEYEFEVLQGQYILAEEVGHGLEVQNARVRQHVMALADRAAALVVNHAGNASKIRDILRTQCIEALEDLSNTPEELLAVFLPADGGANAPGISGAEATPELESESVG